MTTIRGLDAPDRMVGILETLGKPMSHAKIGEVIHGVKEEMKIGPAEDVIVDHSGGTWDSRTGEFIGKKREAV